MRFAELSKVDIKGVFRISFYRNAAYLMLNSVIATASGFVFWILAARFYSPAAVGAASALIAAVTLLSTVSLMGFNMSLIRFLPGEKNPKMLVNCCFSVVLISSTLIALVFLSGISIWSPALSPFFTGLNPAVLFILFTLGTSIVLMLEQAYIAFRSSGYTFAQQSVIQFLKLGLIATLIFSGAFGIFLAWSAPVLLVPFLGLIFLRKIIKGYLPIPSLNKQTIGRMSRFSAGNYFADVLGNSTIYVLPLMIVNILGAEPNAYFRIAYGVASVLFMIPLAVMASLFAEGSNDPDKLKHNVVRSFKLLSIILIPGILIIVLLGEKLLLIFGAEYSDNALSLLWLLALSSLPLGIINIYTAIMRVQFKIKRIIAVLGGIAFCILVGSYLAMSNFGLIGVGIVWVSTISLFAVFLSWIIFKTLFRSERGVLWRNQH